MHPRNVQALSVRALDLGHDRIEVERRGIDDPRRHRRLVAGLGDDRGRHQRAGVEHHRAAPDQTEATHRDQVGRAGAGADEMHRHSGAARVTA